MDTYSYISENGTVRQIEDLIAKAKNEEQDTDIAANRTAINTLSASVDERFGRTMRILPYNDTTAANPRELMQAKLNLAIESGYLQKNGDAVLIPGGWQGSQYGFTIVNKLTGTGYLVSFQGQVNVINAYCLSGTGAVYGYLFSGTVI